MWYYLPVVVRTMKRVLHLSRLRTEAILLVVTVLVIAVMPTSSVAARNMQYAPKGPTPPMDLRPVSLTLSGWGWRIDAGCITCMEYGNAILRLDGSVIPRDNVTDVFDIYLSGTLSFNLPDSTDNFTLELRGTRGRSAFFLRQVAGGGYPLITEFEGVWFDYGETEYVACEGRLALPMPDKVARVYVFVLRNGTTEGIAIPQTSWLGRWTIIFDEIADRMVAAGTQAQAVIGNTMARVAQVLLWWAT